MSRIKAFKFEWTTAWNRINEGYFPVSVKTEDDGRVILRLLVNLKTCCIDLTGREAEFIEDFSFLHGWHGNKYSNYGLDGTMWRLCYEYDNTVIFARGLMGYPVDFSRFLDILHDKYNIPKAIIECKERQDSRTFNKSVVIQKIKGLNDLYDKN